MFRKYRGYRRFFLGTIVFLFMLFSLDCGKQAKAQVSVLPADQLVGVWKNIGHPKKPVLYLNKNGTYFLKFVIGDLQFNGNYHVSGDMIHVLDYYCGTGVPGIYRYKINGNDLTFESVDEDLCDRHKFFAQKWKRVK